MDGWLFLSLYTLLLLVPSFKSCECASTLLSKSESVCVCVCVCVCARARTHACTNVRWKQKRNNTKVSDCCMHACMSVVVVRSRKPGEEEEARRCKLIGREHPKSRLIMHNAGRCLAEKAKKREREKSSF